MLSRSKETERIASMVDAMRENGPMSIADLVKATGWSHETIRAQLNKSEGEHFEQVSCSNVMPHGSVAGRYYLTDSVAGVDECELERRTDDAFRDYGWWPAADQVVSSAMRAMISGG